MNPDVMITIFISLVVMAGSLPRNKINKMLRNAKNTESVEG